MPPKQRIIMLSSPKGGVGKSSLARNILVLAARSRRLVAGIDFDQQATLATWAQRRERVRSAIPEVSSISVEPYALGDWRSALQKVRSTDAEIVVIDTPPSIELNLTAIVSLSRETDLILVPCQQTQDDVDSAGPWMTRLLKTSVRASFVVNRSNRRAKSFCAIRAKLLSIGPVCPVDVPQLEEISLAAGKGLGVMDLTRPNSGETFDNLWSFVMREIGL